MNITVFFLKMKFESEIENKVKTETVKKIITPTIFQGIEC